MGWDVSLSASKLNKFNECKRCFWDYCTKKLDTPRGPFPSITHGVDRVLKAYTDQFRGTGHLPIELLQKVPKGSVFYGTVEQIKKLRNWKSSIKPVLTLESGITVSLIMAFDDLLLGPDGAFSPLDGKSKGDEPKDDGAQYYQRQLDVYALGMQLNGWKISGKGYLWYLWPERYDPTGTTFKSKVYELDCNPLRAIELIGQAVECLKGGQPDASPDCQFCQWAQVRVEAAVQAVAAPLTLQA